MNGLDMTKFDDSLFNFSYDYGFVDENGLNRYERFILMFVNENNPCRIADVFIAGTIFAIWNREVNPRSRAFYYLNEPQLPHTGWHRFWYRSTLSSLEKKGYVEIDGKVMDMGIAPEETMVYAITHCNACGAKRSEYRGEEE